MTSAVQHDLAIAYAQVKLSQYQSKGRKALSEEDFEFDIDEIKYLKAAYLFARESLNE